MILTKKAVLDKIVKLQGAVQRGSFRYRVYELFKNEEFNSQLSSSELIQLLNEGPGKKVKTNTLAASMEPILLEGVVKSKLIGTGRNKNKIWFPAWMDKNNFSDLEFSSDKILFFTGNNAWTDSNKNLPKIIDALKGKLYIVDPYYGNGTFETLEKFGKKREIKFLSATLGKNECDNFTRFEINLKRFKKEFKNIELKKYDKDYELHDRYIIADNALVIIGNGIKDIGNKESFIIFLPKNKVSAFLPTLRKIFKKRWNNSINI